MTSFLNPIIYTSKKTFLASSSWRIWSSICVSNQHRFVYFRIPKAANTSLLYALYLKTGGEPLAQWSREKIAYAHFSHLGGSTLLKGREPLDCYKFFTVSRNPYSRILSAYLQKFSMPEYVARFPNVVPSYDPTPEGYFSFLSFLRNGGLYSDHHWVPQVDFIWPEPGRLDFFVQSETLSSEMDYVFQQLGMDAPSIEFLDGVSQMSSLGSRPTKSSDRLSDFYGGELGHASAGIVAELYAADFDFFDYRKNLW